MDGTFEAKDIEFLVEIRGVYDGYSATVLKDGTIVNRWDAYVQDYPHNETYLRRQRLTQEWIDKQYEDKEDVE